MKGNHVLGIISTKSRLFFGLLSLPPTNSLANYNLTSICTLLKLALIFINSVLIIKWIYLLSSSPYQYLQLLVASLIVLTQSLLLLRPSYYIIISVFFFSGSQKAFNDCHLPVTQKTMLIKHINCLRPR